MRGRSVIQKFLAFGLLLIFVLSITPKLYLHDICADHTDFYGYTSNSDDTVISKAGFNCECQDLVVTTPFIQSHFSAEFTLPPADAGFITASYQQFILTTQYTKDLRGPPGIA